MSRLRTLLLAFAASWAVPARGLACSVCTAVRDDLTESAFRMTTLLLSSLPLAMFGSLVLWLWLRARSRARALAAVSPAGAAPSAAEPARAPIASDRRRLQGPA